MKIKSILVAALAAMTLAACSKDNTATDPELPGEEVTPGEETYATFTVSLTDSNNARAFHGEVKPTPSEAAVDNLTVYIYDYYTDKIEEVITFTDETDAHTVKITTGPKKFLATSGMAPVFAKGDNNVNIENRLVDIADETAFGTTLTTANKFWMTSDIVTHTVISATEAEAETAGNNNHIVMKLGRAMAKIGVYSPATKNVLDPNDPTEATDLGTLSSVEYKIKNQPNQMYVFTEQDVSGVWRTPYFDRNNDLWNDAFAADYWHQQSYHATGLDIDGNHAEPTYMMENSNKVARHGNATYASIVGVFTPAQWFDEDGNDVTVSDPPTTGDDFWRIATAVTYEADGTTVKEVLDWKSDNKIYMEEPNPAILGSNEVPIKYEGGKTYYWIYLNRTLGETNPTNTADKYTQRRNQYWDVEITKINGLGWNDEDGGRPEDPEPLDKDSYIHATIQILNWTGVWMPGELNP